VCLSAPAVKQSFLSKYPQIWEPLEAADGVADATPVFSPHFS